MKNNTLIVNNNIQTKHSERIFSTQLSKKFEKIYLNIKEEIKNPKKTLNVLNKDFRFNFKLKELKKFKKFKTLALVGMGGSILGSEAIHNLFYKKIKKKVYFFDSLEESKILDLRRKENPSKVLFLIISKSGNTIETLSNTFFLNIIKKNSKNVIVISEKKNNFLYTLSKKFNLFFIEHNSSIGGRYSVLSEVGIIPAYLMGINIFKFRSQILDCLSLRNKNFLKESTIKLASLIKSKKFNNLIFLNYSPALEKFLYWCQQMIAESLGKKNLGFLPVISNAPKDHHSLLQLYLDGPKDKIFNIFSLKSKFNETINTTKLIKEKNFLNKKKLDEIKNAQKNALIKILFKKSTPFREFKIIKTNEEVLGRLFSYFMIETVIVGRLLGIDPFNQPAVEQIKIYTKQLLK